ncbi:unnamed protein product [Trifolium pratense]|uniref:Uncharacterized protein n=1 Tax=Trifolium pratense TaxID=57577 RepID=A0ACB0JDC3_TRIPR|nr:unnamed protein product [Trifolium pratense]
MIVIYIIINSYKNPGTRVRLVMDLVKNSLRYNLIPSSFYFQMNRFQGRKRKQEFKLQVLFCYA